MKECWTCRSNSGIQRISPGPTIYEGQCWLVEHAYPVKQKGWLVILLKRHAEALHELSAAEFEELARIQSRLTCLLHETLQCQKEYVACYGEMEHFHHVHFHMFAKPHALPEDLTGGRSFALLKVSEEEAAPREDIIGFCQMLRDLW